MWNELIGEFIGTAVMLLLGIGINAGNTLDKTKSQNSGWVMISIGWGLAVTMGVFTTGNMGPAHLNPAVSFGFAVTGDLPWASFIPYALAQMAGAFVGASLAWLNYKPQYDQTKDQASLLGTFATGPEIRSYSYNLSSEIIGTFVLVFAIMAFGMFDISSGLNPLIVGGLVTVIGFGLGGTTGFAINPARDLAPRLAHTVLPIEGKGSSDWAYSWVPILGPIIGAGIAGLVYLAINML